MMNENECNKKPNPDIITCMSYNEWENIKSEIDTSKSLRLKRERKRKTMYFRRQHFIGSLVFLTGIICLMVGCKVENSILQHFGGIVGMIGLHLILTKQMVIVDNYFLELQDKVNEI